MKIPRQLERSRASTDTTPTPLRRRSPLLALRDHLALEATPQRICWARSRATHNGLQLREWGVIDVPPGRSEASILREISRVPWVRFARVEVALRAPGLVHQRIALPAMSGSEAAQVTRRKLEEFLREHGGDSTASTLCTQGSSARPAWLVVAPAATPPVFEGRWRALGFRVHRLSSEPLALGNLGRVLAPAPDGGLTALLDVQTESGDCVICDSQGWLFNRMIPLQRQGASSDAAQGSEAGAPRLHLERIVTELRRTFQYTEQELRLGRITHLVISGSHPGISVLPADLGQALALPTSLIGDAIPDGPAQGMDPAAARAIAVALSPAAHGGSLLPPQIVRARAERRARRTLIASLGGVCSTVLLVLAGALAQMTWLQNDVDRAARQMESDGSRLTVVQRAARTRENADALARHLRDLRRPEPPVAALLESLRRIAPDHIALRSLAMERRSEGGYEAQLTVEAQGASVSEAAQRISSFADSLRGTPLFAVRSVERTLDAPQLQEGAAAHVQFVLAGTLRTMSHDKPLTATVQPAEAALPQTPSDPGAAPAPAAPALEEEPS